MNNLKLKETVLEALHERKAQTEKLIDTINPNVGAITDGDHTIKLGKNFRLGFYIKDKKVKRSVFENSYFKSKK